MKNKDRKAYYRQQLLEKKISYMTHEDREKMNELLDNIDNEQDEKVKLVLMQTLNSFIDERYETYIKAEILCGRCANFKTCMRRKGVKSCSRFEEESEEENVECK